MVEYRTKSGDTFDKVAFEQLGGREYVAELMAANGDKLSYFEFPAGIKLQLPEIEKTTVIGGQPAWRL